MECFIQATAYVEAFIPAVDIATKPCTIVTPPHVETRDKDPASQYPEIFKYLKYLNTHKNVLLQSMSV